VPDAGDPRPDASAADAEPVAPAPTTPEPVEEIGSFRMTAEAPPVSPEPVVDKDTSAWPGQAAAVRPVGQPAQTAAALEPRGPFEPSGPGEQPQPVAPVEPAAVPEPTAVAAAPVAGEQPAPQPELGPAGGAPPASGPPASGPPASGPPASGPPGLEPAADAPLGLEPPADAPLGLEPPADAPLGLEPPADAPQAAAADDHEPEHAGPDVSAGALAATAAVPAVTPLTADAPPPPPIVVPPATPGGQAPGGPLSEGVASSGAEDPPPARRRGLLAPLLLALLALLAMGGTSFLGWQAWQSARTQDARQEGLAAARDAARLLFSYDHDQLKEDFEAGLATTTGQFREDYRKTTREVVTPVATQYDAVVQAEVVEAAVVSVSPSRLTALVFLNQTTTSTRVEGPKIDQSRVRMHLVERDGTWLVSKVDAL
jgi:Mce-associated membrane protein